MSNTARVSALTTPRGGRGVDTLVGLLPLAIGLAAFGVALWFLLSRNMGIGPWLFAAFLIGHAAVQLMFLFPTPSDAPATANGVANPFDMSKSWLAARAGLDAVRQIATILIVLTLVAYLLAALATVGILVPAAWWPALVVLASALSLVLLTIFVSPALILGFAIDALLVWIALTAVWAPGRLTTTG